MKIKRLMQIGAALALLFTAGCVMPGSKPLFVAPDFRTRQPTSIAILPVQDARLSKEKAVDLARIDKVVRRTIWKYGYEESPTGQTNGVPTGFDITNEEACTAEAQKIGSVLKCDAVLFSRLDDYQAAFRGVYRTDRLEMHFVLREAKSGDRLWEHQTSWHKTRIHGIGVADMALGAIPPGLVKVLAHDWIRSLPPRHYRQITSDDLF